jgi:hypothetical protein
MHLPHAQVDECLCNSSASVHSSGETGLDMPSARQTRLALRAKAGLHGEPCAPCPEPGTDYVTTKTG